MPLSQGDPNLDYDGSWDDASVGWPAIEFSTEEAAKEAYIIAWRDVKVPYGCYVLVGKTLRLETETQRTAVAEACRLLGIEVKELAVAGGWGWVEAFMGINSTFINAGDVAMIAVQPLQGKFRVAGMEIDGKADDFEIHDLTVGVRKFFSKRPIPASVFNLLATYGQGWFDFGECPEMGHVILLVKNVSSSGATFRGKLWGESFKKINKQEGKDG